MDYNHNQDLDHMKAKDTYKQMHMCVCSHNQDLTT